MRLDHAILDHPFGDEVKGMPPGSRELTLPSIAKQNWNVLQEDLPLPLAVIRSSALEHNRQWMRRFLERTGAVICPHGKTTMSPQLFQQQLEDGAWGITLATISQVCAARRCGVSRILLANQLVGRTAIRFVLQELERDPDFEFFCLVDSEANVDAIVREAEECSISRPLSLLVEVGVAAGRTGCRTAEDALRVARHIALQEPHAVLAGVEGFEGLIGGETPELRVAAIEAFLDTIVQVAEACEAEDLFGVQPVILSAGGSAFFDLVVERLGKTKLKSPKQVITRSGCYLTHDAGLYLSLMADIEARSAVARSLGEPPRPALEVWAYVQSRPETSRVVLTMGRRDASFDAGLPTPMWWYRPGMHHQPQPLSDGHITSGLHDQHAILDVPEDSPLRFGDMVGCGISHPCTTFDKWKMIPTVDDDYHVVGAIQTMF